MPFVVVPARVSGGVLGAMFGAVEVDRVPALGDDAQGWPWVATGSGDVASGDHPDEPGFRSHDADDPGLKAFVGLWTGDPRTALEPSGQYSSPPGFLELGELVPRVNARRDLGEHRSAIANYHRLARENAPARAPAARCLASATCAASLPPPRRERSKSSSHIRSTCRALPPAIKNLPHDVSRTARRLRPRWCRAHPAPAPDRGDDR